MNELGDIAAFVAAQTPFTQVPAAAVEALAPAISISYERRGTRLLGHGEANSELHMIRRGAVGLFEADGTLIEKRAEGELFGYPSLLTGQPVMFEIRTLEDSLIYHLPGDRFARMRASWPEFDRYFTLALVERVRAALKRPAAEDVFADQAVAKLMSAPVVGAGPDTPIAAAARLMTERGVSALLILSAERPVGILTDRDLRMRVLAADVPPDTPVSAVMTAAPTGIGPRASAIGAQLTMMDARVHHLPVIDDERAIGMVTLTDLTRAQPRQPVHVVSHVLRQGNPVAVAAAAERRFDLLARLLATGASARHIGHVMTAVTDAATRRLLELGEAQLGPPPLPYAWLCFGSQARREQSGRTDQDNGLLFAREPSATEAAYFEALASFACDGLHAAGFDHCPGDIMASNPHWRMSLAGWQRQFRDWIETPDPKPLMYVSIFFDLRCVAGDEALVVDLQDYVFARTQGNSIFLRFMAENALSFRPPLGFFRQFLLEESGSHSEGLNLKQRGVVPIISLARMRALRYGLATPDTAGRLERLMRERPELAQDTADLLDAFELIGRVRLEQQAEQLRAGDAPTNLIDPDELSQLARRNLKAAFGVVRSAQQALARRHHLG